MKAATTEAATRLGLASDAAEVISAEALSIDTIKTTVMNFDISRSSLASLRNLEALSKLVPPIDEGSYLLIAASITRADFM